ncbi:MAG: glycosyltransferase [Bacteroidales bacterium]|nr:glycosyltransferase [Bacteroidales bacterium]
MPKISIIVPVYKVEKYLQRCLDSIKAQTFTDWECILVDDGSPDNSGMICEKYAVEDERFKVFHQNNAGVSAARNKGLDEAKGDWISFVDSDDWIEKEMLAKLFQSAISNHAEVVISGFNITDGIKKTNEYAPSNGWLKMPNDFKWYVQGPWSKLFLRSYLCNNDIRFPKGIVLAEDLFFTFQVFYNCKKIYGLESIFYNYYINSASVTQNISLKEIQHEIAVLKMIERTNGNGFDKEWWNWLNTKKQLLKDRFYRDINPPRFDLWRKTFSEVNSSCLKNVKLTKKLLYIFILSHCDFVARLILNKVRNKKSSVIIQNGKN